MDSDTTKQLLRIGAGALAVIALGVVALRIYAISKTGMWQPDPFLQVLRLIFPLSVAAIFGYVAWKGSVPFLEKKQ
jgi:hypothetical protein